jgi:hypothetical protein
VLTGQIDEISVKETSSKENKVEKDNIVEENKEEAEIVIPSLEDILSMGTQDISNAPKPPENNLSDINNKVLSEIEEEYIKIVGPFGKYVFRSKQNELLRKGNIGKSDVLEFIQSLAEDIPENDKRDLFLKNTKNLLTFIL